MFQTENFLLRFEVSNLLHLSSFLILLFSVFSVGICWAQESAMDAIPGCRERGDCELDDFVWLFVFYYDKFLGLVGSLALLMFIYGGVMFCWGGDWLGHCFYQLYDN